MLGVKKRSLKHRSEKQNLMVIGTIRTAQTHTGKLVANVVYTYAQNTDLVTTRPATNFC